MKLNEFSGYAEDIRTFRKKELFKMLDGDFDLKRQQLEEECKMASSSLIATNIHKGIERLNKDQEAVLKVYRNETLLNIYLDGIVRDFIISLIKLIAAGPYMENKFLFAIQALNKRGFEDAEDYFLGFDNVEDVRRDLFEQAGLDYVAYNDLCRELKMAQTNLDEEELLRLKAEFKKAGIDESTEEYVKGEYQLYELYEVAKLTEKELELLVNRKTGKCK